MRPDDPLQLEQDLLACKDALRRAQRFEPRVHVYRGWEAMHPKCASRFIELSTALQKNTPFRVFETYRNPIRQNYLYHGKPQVTKANAWQSAHQYKVAADFVGYVDGMWS